MSLKDIFPHILTLVTFCALNYLTENVTFCGGEGGALLCVDIYLERNSHLFLLGWTLCYLCLQIHVIYNIYKNYWQFFSEPLLDAEVEDKSSWPISFLGSKYPGKLCLYAVIVEYCWVLLFLQTDLGSLAHPIGGFAIALLLLFYGYCLFLTRKKLNQTGTDPDDSLVYKGRISGAEFMNLTLYPFHNRIQANIPPEDEVLKCILGGLKGLSLYCALITCAFPIYMSLTGRDRKGPERIRNNPETSETNV